MEKKHFRYSEQLNLNFEEPRSILRNRNEHSPIKQNKRKITKNNLLNISKSISPSKKHHHHSKSKDIDTLFFKNDNNSDDQEDNSSKPCHYISSPVFHSFKEYSYQEEKNEKFRDTMEDCAKIFDHFTDDPYKSFFSLFDGHGGFEVAKYASEHFYKLFSKYLLEHKTKVEKALKKSFLLLDEELKKFKSIDNIGSTATVIFINRETDAMLGTKKVLYCANIGDSACVLFSKSGCKKLSYDHKCTDETEITRIKRAGGVIVNERLNGKLAISRAFGDFSMKSKGLTCEPFINKIVLSESDKFIILCTDGIWDVINEEDLFYLTLNMEQTEQIARDIIKQALDNGSTDNMSCIVIKL